MEKRENRCIPLLTLWMTLFCRHSIHAFTPRSISTRLSIPNSTCINRRKNLFPLHLSFSEEIVANDEVTDVNGEDANDTSASETVRNEIAVDAAIDLPFGAEIAFDAFSDLPRQPSWSSWLRSVSYIEEDGSSSRGENDDDIIIQNEEKEKRRTYFINESSCIDVGRLRQTKWVMGWKRIRFSWKSKVTFMERPKCIKWESTSGLKNMGLIEFEEQTLDGGTDSVTRMTLKIKFIAPRIVARAMKRSDKIDGFMKSKILQPTLIKFRDVVLVNDLGMEAMSVEA